MKDSMIQASTSLLKNTINSSLIMVLMSFISSASGNLFASQSSLQTAAPAAPRAVIKLITSDSRRFVVPLTLLRKSKTIQNMVEDTKSYEPVFLSIIDGHALEACLSYLQHEKLPKNLTQELLASMLHAAEFLDIISLKYALLGATRKLACADLSYLTALQESPVVSEEEFNESIAAFASRACLKNLI